MEDQRIAPVQVVQEDDSHEVAFEEGDESDRTLKQPSYGSEYGES